MRARVGSLGAVLCALCPARARRHERLLQLWSLVFAHIFATHKLYFGSWRLSHVRTGCLDCVHLPVVLSKCVLFSVV